MIFTSEIVNSMVDAINKNLKPANCTAIRGFDTKGLPIPLPKLVPGKYFDAPGLCV